MRDVVLDRENISQIAVVSIGPKMPATRRIDELRVDPHAIASAADRAFEYRLHAQLLADGANIDRAPLVGKARVACDHPEAGNLGQVGDDVFAYTVREILLLWIPRHIDEW